MAKSLDGVQTKKAYKKEKFTDEQLQEFAKCANPKTGVYYFMNNHFAIQHLHKVVCNTKHMSTQHKLLQVYHNYRFNINMLTDKQVKVLLPSDICYGMQCLYPIV